MSDLQAMVDRFLDDYDSGLPNARASMASALAAFERAWKSEALREADKMLVQHFGRDPNPSLFTYRDLLTRRADEVSRCARGSK